MASNAPVPPQSIVREAVVLVSMALTTIAIGTALHLEAGFGFGSALAAALGAYGLMLFAHGLYRRFVSEREGASGRIRATEQSGTASARDDLVDRVAEVLRELSESGAEARPDTGSREEAAALRDAASARSHGSNEGAHGQASVARAATGLSGTSGMDKAGGPRAANAPSRAATGGSGRRVHSGPSMLQDLPPPRYEPVAERPIPPPQPPRAADVEMIQALIKKLADEVNAVSFDEGVQSDGRGSDDAKRLGTDAAVVTGADLSVDALKSAAQGMRPLDDRATAQAAAMEPAAGAGAPADRLADHQGARLEAIRSAIEAGRIDVFLDPIVGLGDSRMQHYDVGLRLRDKDDNQIVIDSGTPGLRGSGVHPLIDQLQLERTSALAGKLYARGKTGSVFSKTRGESLIADPFLDTFADAYGTARETFASQLVMTFTQEDVRAFGQREWATLADMADLGFRFAIASVSDLDMDFEDLVQRNFRFLKLDADVFLDGLPAGESVVPAEDICKHVSKLGMTVIVGGIVSEEARAQIFGFGVLLGQGELFGAPRLVKAEAVMPRRTGGSGGVVAA